MVQFPIVAKFNPEAAAPDTDFRDKNAVDRFLECGKFRLCANLKAVRANLRDATVYMPVRTKARFNRRALRRISNARSGPTFGAGDLQLVGLLGSTHFLPPQLPGI